MAKKYQAPLGASLVVLASIFYASYGIWTTLIGGFLDGLTATVIRGSIVVAILLPLMLLRHSFEPLRLKDNWHYILAMTVASPLSWGLFYYAILHAGIGMSLTINYASIVIGQFCFGWLLAGEKFTRGKAVSAILALVGLALVFSPGGQSIALLGLGAACVAGLAAGANAVFAKQIKYHATQATIVWWTTGILGNAIVAALLNRHYPALSLDIRWLYVACFALASVISSWSLVRGVKLIDAGAAGILGLLEIVFGILFGAVLFGERPGPIVLIGAAVIIAAAAVPYIRDYNAQKGTLE